MKRREAGFTLSELLIVVAIIAVLVAIAIPVFSAQLHKARVATDWANVRAYYAELQSNYLETGKIDNSKLHETSKDPVGLTSFELAGETVDLAEGSLWVAPCTTYGKGYNLFYACNKLYSHRDCMLTLPTE